MIDYSKTCFHNPLVVKHDEEEFELNGKNLSLSFKPSNSPFKRLKKESKKKKKQMKKKMLKRQPKPSRPKSFKPNLIKK